MKPPSTRTPPHANGSAQQGTGRAPALYLRAQAVLQAGEPRQALELCAQALAIDPDNLDALHLAGVVAFQLGDRARALAALDRAVALGPAVAELWNNRSALLHAMGRSGEALDGYDRALALKRDYVDAHMGRAATLRVLGRSEEAVAAYDRAIALAPDSAAAHNDRGGTLRAMKRLDDALASLDRAIELAPDHAEAHNNRGATLQDLRRYDEALASFEQALRHKPDFAEALFNRGGALQAARRLVDAIDSYQRALRIDPRFADAWNDLGALLAGVGRHEEAVACFDRAIALAPKSATALNNRGNSLERLGRLTDSLASYARALEIEPDREFLFGLWLHMKMKLCDWTGFEENLADLIARIERGERCTPPFTVLALVDSPPLQLQAARVWSSHAVPPAADTLPSPRPSGGRIRIGYFSADFHSHATAYLMAELFELHDRERFELIAFSFGPDRDDEMRRRVESAFDRFIDVRDETDRRIAARARGLGIDIAVDLKGATGDQRFGIFAERAAPIQVNYLGFPATMGADVLDYIVADRTLVPAASRGHYAEKIVYLPGSYQVNDRKRTIAASTPSRAELGLPAAGFVFCCFNNVYKILPENFAAWMRILTRVPGSVLMMLDDNPVATANLRAAAAAQGVDPARLVFGGRLPMAEHLARLRATDLFIDTSPCNAHTTASDALWAGVPVLTLAGESFASRVAASLLTAIDLPELIVRDRSAYEALAIELATDPPRLLEHKRRLAENRETTPLFDTTAYARHLEAAYQQMHERRLAGLPPDHIVIEA